ncbi:hypothetical protein TIFTF001_025500 [Ficus carica]|uniref:Receptor-like protein 12 n=1 Tax=Ficus carica TaxID=3494 RepID=A0AA88AJY8_FICCA|nr:hypothetical protein TIFTF001_025500 [Ficus carica]
MKTVDANDSRYMEASELITNLDGTVSVSSDYAYSTTIVNKGVERHYEVIQENFVQIDFSCNKFTGEIPRNLTELESLDLSNNKLSGEIPQGLTRLTFLQSFDVSHNNFTGSIPQANQFGTFENTSFVGNPGLCGIPLSKKCDDSKALPRPPSAVKEDGGSGSPVGLDWIFVLAGGISGFVVGVALGDMVITKSPGWFVKAFRRTPPRRNIRQHMN